MCLIAFAINASARWPLVVASNRDEFLDRPTLPLARWKTASGQEIISGRDGRAGGTWLGVTPTGRVAFLTNVREPKNGPAKSTRGELVTRWLKGSCGAEEFTTSLMEKSAASYSGFNLVVGDLHRDAWTWLTNRASAPYPGWYAQALTAGVYGLSNASLDTPWPKTLELKRVLSAALSQAESSDGLHGMLWPALASRGLTSLAGASEMNRRMPMESALSSAFVDMPALAYGTRSSTVLTVSRSQGDHLSATTCCTEVQERSHLRESADGTVAGFLARSLVV